MYTREISACYYVVHIMRTCTNNQGFSTDSRPKGLSLLLGKECLSHELILQTSLTLLAYIAQLENPEKICAVCSPITTSW